MNLPGTYEAVLRGSPRQALIAGTIAFFGGFAAVALFNITVQSLAPLLGLGIIEIGVLVSIPMSTGALMRIPFSAWVETLGGRRVLLIQLFIASLGMMGIILTIYFFSEGILRNKLLTYCLLLLFGALAGVGISVFSPGVTYVSYWFPKTKQGTALGIYAGLGNTAPGIFTAILPHVLAILGLLGAYIVWLAFLLSTAIVFFLIGHDAYYYQLIRRGLSREEALREAARRGEELFPTYSAVKSLKISAMNWRVWLLVIMYMTSFGGFVALTAWLPTYWTKYIGVSSAMAGFLTGVLFSLLTSLIRVAGGYLSDKLGGEIVALYSYATVLAGSIIFITSRDFTTSLLGEIVTGVGMGMANAAVFKMVPKYAPEAVGGASGWVGGIGAAGGLLFPPILALFVFVFGLPGYAIGFVLFVIFSIVSILFSMILRGEEK